MSQLIMPTERVLVAGVGKCLPSNVVTNNDVIDFLASHGVTTTDSGKPLTSESIVNSSTIHERRRIDPNLDVSDLARDAAEDALHKAGIWWPQIDVVYVGSSSGEAAFPSTACIMLGKATDCKAEAVDVLAACTSGLQAMLIVKSRLMDEPDYHYGLVVGAEVIASRLANPHYVNYDLWGDGAGAVVLKKATGLPCRSTGRPGKLDEMIIGDAGIICSMAGSVPEMADKAVSQGMGTRKGFENMPRDAWFDGGAIFRFILELVPKIIPDTIAKANRIYYRPHQYPGLTLEDIDVVILHQANGRAFDPVAKRVGIPPEKFYRNVERYGNTSSASVFIALCEAIEEKVIKPGSLVSIVAFGSGLTWASVLIRF